MKFSLILIVIMITNVIKPCTEGCLKCDPKLKMCEYCDNSKGYVTKLGRCEYRPVENCLYQNFEGSCIKCGKNYFVDEYNYKCAPIPEFGLTPGCAQYKANLVCEVCESPLKLDNKNKCIEVTTPITGCIVYNSEFSCKKCEIGQLLAPDQKSCISPTPEPNCASYTQLKCEKCKPNYQNNPNNYIYELLSFTNKRNIRLLEKQRVLDIGTQDNAMRYNTCQLLNMPNCKNHVTFNECANCDDNYFLSGSECVAYPHDRIDNCEKYSQLTVCVHCIKGHYLKSSTECVKISSSDYPSGSSLENCNIFDGSADQIKCLECHDQYFLSEANICSARTGLSDIENCKTLYIDQERCKECNEGYERADNNKKCFPIIENCLTYEPDTTTSLTCNICKEGFYYSSDTKKCVEGQIKKCKIYSRTTETCEVCENRHYLSGGVCKTHEDLIYCDEYSNNKRNSCNICNDKTVKFFITNTCLPVIEIEFCETYETQTTCLKCNDGYTLTINKTCELIPGNEFCLQKQGGLCIKCLKNYILQEGNCRLPIHSLTRNCASDTVDGLKPYSELVCHYCNEFSIPINYKNTFVCYENDYIEFQLFVQGETRDPNCLQYKKMNDMYKCISCVKGMFVQNYTCVNTCTTTVKEQVLKLNDLSGDSKFDSFNVEITKECVPEEQDCKVLAPDLDQDLIDVAYSCVECKDNKIAVVGFDNKRILLKQKQFNTESPILTPVSFAPSKTCRSLDKILGEGDGSSGVSFCDLYYNMEGFGFGCLKCNHGYTGEVVDVVFKCKKFSSLTKCVECEQGFYPLHDYLCAKVTPIINCEEYQTTGTDGLCVKCKDAFYVDTANGNICKERGNNNVENCKDYKSDEDKCISCEDNFHIRVVDSTCHKDINECKTYNADQDECTECNNKSYLRNRICYEGQVDECETYKDGAVNICLTCENGYYLDDNICHQQTNILGCSKYEQDKGFCNKCEINNFLMLKTKECVAVIQVENCLKYKTKESCKLCADGFYPVNYGQRCLEIPTEKQCQKWGELETNSHDEDNCLLCNDGYILVDKKCRDWFKSIHTNCDTTKFFSEVGTLTSRTCTYCADEAEPQDLNTTGICIENSLIDAFENNFEKIENCVKYDSVQDVDGNDSSTCLKCSLGYFLLVGDNLRTTCITQQECIATGDSKPINYTLKAQVTLEKDQNAVCKKTAQITATLSIDNCILSPYLEKVAVIDANDATGVKYGCTQCFDNYIAVVDLATIPHLLISYSSSKPTRNPFSTVPIIECIDPLPQIIRGNVNPRNIIQGCDYYYKLELADAYGCFSCRLGKTGPLMDEKTDDADANLGFIQHCTTDITDCDISDTQPPIMAFDPRYPYVDDPFHYSIVFNSCRKCITVTNVPISLVKFDNTANFAGIVGLSFDGTTNAVRCDAPATVAAPDVTDCSKYVSTLFGTPNTTLTDSSTPGTTFCAECSPGFKAERDSRNQPIASCTAIAGCTADATKNTWNNACETCEDGKIWKYDETNNRVLFDECIDFVDPNNDNPNCLSATTASLCKLCKPGSTLNATNICEKVDIPFCKDANDNSRNSPINTSSVELLHYFFAYVDDLGCNECSNGKTPVLNVNTYLTANNMATISNICVIKTPYVDIPNPNIDECVTTPNTYNWKKNLLQNLDVYCINCNTGFIITQDGNCADVTNHQFCQLALNITGNYCVTCNINFINVAGTCQDKNTLDQNCTEFANNSTSTAAICNKCKDKYYLQLNMNGSVLESTNCVLYSGPIKNCAQFNAENINFLYCIQCLSNHTLLILEGDEVNGIKGRNRKCVSSLGYQQSNCLSFDLDSQTIGQLVCEECESNFFLTDLTDSYNTCVPIGSGSYLRSITTEFSDPATINYTFIPIKNCEELETKTKCIRCEVGYRILNEGMKCDAIDVNTNCAKWVHPANGTSLLNQCEICKDDYVLYDGQCMLPLNYQKEFCNLTLGYLPSSTNSIPCLFCADGAQSTLVDDYGICVEDDYIDKFKFNGENIKIDNCVRYQYNNTDSRYECIRCDTNFYVDDTDSKQNCLTQVQCLDVGIPINIRLQNRVGAGAILDNLKIDGPYCAEKNGNSKLDNCLGTYVYTKSIYDKTTSINDSIGCISCLGNTIPIVERMTDFQFGLDIRPGDKHPSTTLPVVVCKEVTQTQLKGTTTQIGTSGKYQVTDCKYYYKLNPLDLINHEYGCISCAFEKSGLIKNTSGNENDNLNAFIESCDVDIVECDTTFEIQNAVFSYEQIVALVEDFHPNVFYQSCQKCQNAKILVSNVNFKTGAAYDGVKGLLQEGTGTLSTFCEDPAALTQQTGGLALTEIPNCQLYFVSSKGTYANADASVGNGFFFCSACEPGYEGTRHGTQKQMISACTPIANCDLGSTQTWLSSCSVCSGANKHDLGTLVLNTCLTTVVVTNCLIHESDNTCILCEPTYTLKGGVCYQLVIPNCKNGVNNAEIMEGGFFLKQTYISLLARYSDRITQGGCTSCEANYTGVENPTTFLTNLGYTGIHNKFCIQSTPLEAVAGNGDGNCQLVAEEYKVHLPSNNDKCVKCNVGFIPTTDGVCVNNTSQPQYVDCVIALTTPGPSCIECTGTKKLFNGTCVEPDAECSVFDPENPSECLLCNNDLLGFHPRITAAPTEQCKTIPANTDENCTSILTDGTTVQNCTSCKTGFQLQNDAGTYKCISEDELIVCIDFTLGSGSIADQTLCGMETQLCEEFKIDTLLTHNYQNVLYKNNYLPLKSSLKCVKCFFTHYLKQDTNECEMRERLNAYDGKCLEFEIFEDFCMTCKENYFLSFDKESCIGSPIKAQSIGHIWSCSEMEDCDKLKQYQGLHPHLASILSCHVCKNPSEIPFVAVKGAAEFTEILGLNKYGLANNANKYSQQEKGQSVFCSEPTDTALNIDNAKFAAISTNCGIGLINVNSLRNNTASDDTTNIDRTLIGAFCAACKPMYKAVRGTDVNGDEVKFLITDCVLIANCEESQAFNYCTRCKQNFGFKYKDSEVQYDTCVSLPVTNTECFAYDEDNTKCKYCCKGYYLNEDDICERINPPKCETAQFGFQSIYYLKDLSTGLYLNNRGTGCTKCKTGYTAIHKDSNHWLCTESQVHADLGLTNATNYINNCKLYKVMSNLLRCVECYTGFVPLKQSGTCVANTNLSNCKIANDSQFCSICDDGFVLVNRTCEKENIDKCVNYIYDDDSNKQTCSDCDKGYYLTNNECKPGSVPNCLLYETETVCNQCNKNFHLVKRTDGVSYCYPIDPVLQCKAFDSNEFQKGRLQCTQCINNEFVIDTNSNNFYVSHCMKFFEEANCVKYDVRPAIGDSSFECQQCTPNFFLTNKKCNTRIMKPNNCSEYNINSDQCIACKNGFFIDSEGKNCIIYPVGVPNCNRYSDIETCTRCKTGFYLFNNICNVIVTEDEVANCLYYAQPKVCEVCIPQFLLQDGNCVDVVAQNCLTYSDINACDTCPTGFGFPSEQPTNNIRSCEAITKANCNLFEVDPPNNCIICDPLYYVLDGECVLTTEIVNCVQYDSEITCVKCSSTTALNTERTQCINSPVVTRNIDENCEYTNLLKSTQCNACKSGFVFNEGKCIPCEVEQMERCYNCDPQNLKRCLLCKTGFVHDLKGACIPKEELPEEIDPDDEGKDGKDPENPDKPTDPTTPTTPTDPTTPTSSIVRAIVSLILGLTLIL